MEASTSSATSTSAPVVVETPDFSNVRTFILFVGYPRSGHSLIGSIMDAHPNVIIAHEVRLCGDLAGCGPNMACGHAEWPHTTSLLAVAGAQYDVVGKLESYMTEDGKARLYSDLFLDSKNMAFREGGRQHNNYKYAQPTD
jgi:hypothetical protein